MRRTRAALIPLLGVLLACEHHDSDGPREETQSAPSALGAPVETFFVVLEGPAAVRAIPPGADVRSPEAAAATRRQLREIEAEQAAMEARVVAEGGEVVARLTRLVNALQVVTDDVTAGRLAKLAGVRRVERVPVLERSLLSAVPTVGAPSVWAGIPGYTGEGIVIGVIDSGIDYTHADFGGAGTVAAYAANDGTMIEPGSFPTPKVVGGWDFAGDAFNPSGNTPSPMPDADPLDCTTPGGEQISGGHGTHVAGIAAGMGVAADGSTFIGPYEATLNPNEFRVGPGVAPGASLYALKVFGCEGSTTLLAAALDRAADPNMDGSFEDRLDVINASLGTSYALGADTTGELISELTAVGTLVVVAAGNDGQSFFALGSPAAYPEVLAVAASVDNNLLNLQVTSPPSAVATIPAAEGGFTVPVSVTGPIASEVVLADPVLGCGALTNAADIAGKVALIRRGTCPFVDKFANAVSAGAIAVIIRNDADDALPFAMFGAPGSSPIPGVMVTQDDGGALETALATGPVTVGLDAADRYTGSGAEYLAGFSSRGPSAVDGRLKPEITAPGQAIDSAGVGSGTEARSSQGTSQACPMVAGAAALVRQAQPALSPIQVKSALMNGAAPLRNFSLELYATTVIGAGRLDTPRAVESEVILAANLASGEVGVSFGSLIETDQATVTRSFEVTNLTSTAKTLALSVAPTFTLPGVTVTVEPTKLTLAAGLSATASLTLTFDPAMLGDAGADPGTPAIQGQQNPLPRHYLNQASGLVRVDDGTSEAVLPYTGSLRAASSETVLAPSACDAALSGEPTTLVRQDTGAHPNSVVSAFQLIELDEADEDSVDDPVVAMADLRAVGVATNLATVSSFKDAMVYFAVAVEGPWATAARGPISVVKIRVDSDQSGSSDFEIRVEARNPDSGYRDALVASTYEVSSGDRIERYPVNILTPDIARTYPFNSTVLVIPANLDELEIDEDNPIIDFSARTERADLVSSSDTASGTFDARNPLIDTAVHGLDGQPIFLGADPLRVQLGDGALDSGEALDVLLLHHTNRPGQQWEVVSLVKGTVGNLSITSDAPDSLGAEETGEVSFVVSNPSELEAASVVLTADVLGGQLVDATTAAGNCIVGAALECSLGDMSPGDTVEITVSVRGLGSATELALNATLSSELPCELDENDNQLTVTIAVEPAVEEPKNVFEPTGGCDCSTTMSSRPHGAGWLALAIAGALAGRRNRPTSARRPPSPLPRC